MNNIIYGTGKNFNNNGRSYDLTIFGDWVRHQREENKGWTLDRAAQGWNENVGSKLDTQRTFIASDWRRFELLGKTRKDSRQNYNGLIRPNHCQQIADSLGILLDDVREAAGFQRLDKMQRIGVITLTQDMSNEEYQRVLDFIIQVRDDRHHN